MSFRYRGYTALNAPMLVGYDALAGTIAKRGGDPCLRK